MSFSAAPIFGTFEVGMALAGTVLLWRRVLSPAARAHPASPALAPWDAPLSEFALFVVSALGGSFVGTVLAGVLLRALRLQGDEITVFSSALAQLGMLAGVLIYGSRRQARGTYAGTHAVVTPPPLAAPRPNMFVAGAATFLMALPILIVTAALWEQLLKVCGLPASRQSLIGMFANAESFWLVACMLGLAVFIAPLTEELVFRAGLFRYLRTRMPRWIAFLAPAIFFASLHVNWRTLEGLSSLGPLVTLAVVFSFAYERTGRIGTAIVAHALFNLNTIVLIYSGLGVT